MLDEGARGPDPGARLLDFVDARNQALVDHGMGVGEYLYIYSTAYYSWLGKDPADGPDFAVSDAGDGDDHAGPGESRRFRWTADAGDKDPAEVRRRREAEVRRYLNRIETPMLANQLEAARAAGLDAAWLATLDRSTRPWRPTTSACCGRTTCPRPSPPASSPSATAWRRPTRR